jgi:hypothetical protein
MYFDQYCQTILSIPLYIRLSLMLCIAANMAKENDQIHRITANIPQALLERAQKITGQGITETLTQGLELLCQSEAAKLAEQLKGKIKLRGDHGASRS